LLRWQHHSAPRQFAEFDTRDRTLSNVEKSQPQYPDPRNDYGGRLGAGGETDSWRCDPAHTISIGSRFINEPRWPYSDPLLLVDRLRELVALPQLHMKNAKNERRSVSVY